MNCPYCGAKARLHDSSFIYGKDSHECIKLWVCDNFPSCDSYVSCHKGTTIPKGRLANKNLRDLKKEAHIQFDIIWKSGLMTRDEAYSWLSDMMHIPLTECHIGKFSNEQCKRVIKMCKKQDNPLLNRYRHKVDIKRSKKNTYVNKH